MNNTFDVLEFRRPKILLRSQIPRQFRNGFLVAISAKPNAPGGPRRRSTAFSPTSKEKGILCKIVDNENTTRGKLSIIMSVPFPPCGIKYTWAMKYIISASFILLSC